MASRVYYYAYVVTANKQCLPMLDEESNHISDKSFKKIKSKILSQLNYITSKEKKEILKIIVDREVVTTVYKGSVKRFTGESDEHSARN